MRTQSQHKKVECEVTCLSSQLQKEKKIGRGSLSRPACAKSKTSPKYLRTGMAGGVAQVAECLLHKCYPLTSNLKTTGKK
jgi:hypothetical protein